MFRCSYLDEAAGIYGGHHCTIKVSGDVYTTSDYNVGLHYVSDLTNVPNSCSDLD